MLRFKSQGRAVQSPGAIINNAVMHEMNKLQKGMGILATTANVSPLIGLLGTVWGIMYSFINIGERGSVSIDVVAPGIAEALITTIAGLCVAIPAMVGHNFLSVWINNCMDSIERISEYAISLFIEESKK
ncbi:MotA/TolQ/ExbB proton channel family protein [Candidatus Latescibacterota bacterium]